MAHGDDIAGHYSRGDLQARLRAALIADGADPDRPTLADLAPYDQFHGRGIEATEELLGRLSATAGDHILDVGSGIGGPARAFAAHFGCRVTGIDLTPPFVALARHLTALVGLADRVAFEQGDALAMPFADAAFDGAYSMNVSMNIADKRGLYREVGRVLRPGAWLALSEIARGTGAPDYPTPWARDVEHSFLATPGDTLAGLESAGFTIVGFRDTVEPNLAYGARGRAMVERGDKPPHRAVTLIHDELARDAMANTARALSDGRIIPIEVVAKWRG